MAAVIERTADKLDRVWAHLPSADRVVLLGHDRDALSVADKIRLARITEQLSRRNRGRRR